MIQFSLIERAQRARIYSGGIMIHLSPTETAPQARVLNRPAGLADSQLSPAMATDCTGEPTPKPTHAAVLLLTHGLEGQG